MKKLLLLLMIMMPLMAMAQEAEPKPKLPPADQKQYDQYIEAARNGDAEAQWQVARSCDPQDIDYAIYWLRNAGEQGHEMAMTILIAVYGGEFKPHPEYKNEEQAVYWVRKINEKRVAEGSAKAMVILGNFYYLGQGGKKDSAKALELFLMAANQPNPDDKDAVAAAETMIGNFYHNSIGVDNDDKLAVYWFKRAAEHNEPWGQGELAKCYFNGEGVEQDYNQAVYWFERAKNNGNSQIEGWLVKAKEKQKEQQALIQSQDTKELPLLPAMPVKDVTNVDENIPQVSQQASTTYAVIIGNEQYENEAAVPFAEHDAQVFAEYVKKTLGVPEKNIRLIANAGLNRIRGAVRWLKEAMEATGGQGKVIVYYAGHGIPDEANKNAYLLPVDGIGSDVESAYSLTRLYKELGALPAERITVFLDACFSGAKREGDMMASARGVAIKVKEETPQGKMIVFTAAQGDETAYPYTAQKHGMFTYYLLKKLQETKGNTTLGELGDYLTTEVKRQSFVENNKVQTPSIVPSFGMQDKWRSLSFK